MKAKHDVVTLDQAPQARQMPVEVNPMQLIQIALQTGADIEKLERLMALQERWDATNARKEFDAAMALFKAEMPVVPMRGDVDYTSTKGRTVYRYGRMEDAAKLADPILSRCGLSYRFEQTQNGGMIEVSCIVTHASGHSIRNTMSAPPDQSGGKDPIKAMASTVSYLRRYTLTGSLGIVFSGEDSEGVFDSDNSHVNADQLNELLAALCDANGNLTPKGAKITSVMKIQFLRDATIPQYERMLKMAGVKK